MMVVVIVVGFIMVLATILYIDFLRKQVKFYPSNWSIDYDSKLDKIRIINDELKANLIVDNMEEIDEAVFAILEANYGDKPFFPSCCEAVYFFTDELIKKFNINPSEFGN